MKKLGKLSFCRLFIVIGLIAVIGFCFTPVLADDSDSTPGSQFYNQDEIITPENIPDDPEAQDEQFGDKYQYTWIPAYDFVPAIGSANMYFMFHYGFLNTSGSVLASVKLPSGEYLHSARLYFYDWSGGNLSMQLQRHYNWNEETLLCSTGSFGIDGYGFRDCNVNTTINNRLNTYRVVIGFSIAGGNDSLKFKGVRLYWKRQINEGLPHPFTDIGHLPAVFRNSIAAMAASGITAGTSPTTFSPNDPVTRAQMAVFLARALGLYFPD